MTKAVKKDPPAAEHGMQSKSQTAYVSIVVLIVLVSIGAMFFSSDKMKFNLSAAQSEIAFTLDDLDGAGRLTLVPITIAPPLDFIRAQSVLTEINDWHFKELDPLGVQRFLLDAGLEPSTVTLLVDRATFNSEVSETVVPVNKDLLWGLKPDVRQRIYIKLTDDHKNPMQLSAYRYCGKSLDDWFNGADVSEELKNLISKFIYRDGCYMFFADLPLILDRISMAALPKLLHALYRQSTYLVKLNIFPEVNVDGLVNYWGYGGRAKDVRSILESMMRIKGGEKIDIVHVLPPSARRRLYTFPPPGTEVVGAGHRDCHWTAYNFFNLDPDDRFADPAIIAATLRSDYVEVDKPRYGDLVTYSRPNGVIFHTANYIASGLVYTKTGSKATWPWLIAKVDDMAHFYPKTTPILLRYFRLKSLNR